MKKPAKAAPWGLPLGLPWAIREGAGSHIEDRNGHLIAWTALRTDSVLQYKRAARIARFIVDCANRSAGAGQ